MSDDGDYDDDPREFLLDEAEAEIDRLRGLLRRLLDIEDIGFSEVWVKSDGTADWTLDGHITLSPAEVAALRDLGMTPEENQ